MVLQCQSSAFKVQLGEIHLTQVTPNPASQSQHRPAAAHINTADSSAQHYRLDITCAALVGTSWWWSNVHRRSVSASRYVSGLLLGRQTLPEDLKAEVKSRWPAGWTRQSDSRQSWLEICTSLLVRWWLLYDQVFHSKEIIKIIK